MEFALYQWCRFEIHATFTKYDNTIGTVQIPLVKSSMDTSEKYRPLPNNGPKPDPIALFPGGIPIFVKPFPFGITE